MVHLFRYISRTAQNDIRAFLKSALNSASIETKISLVRPNVAELWRFKVERKKEKKSNFQKPYGPQTVMCGSNRPCPTPLPGKTGDIT